MNLLSEPISGTKLSLVPLLLLILRLSPRGCYFEQPGCTGYSKAKCTATKLQASCHGEPRTFPVYVRGGCPCLQQGQTTLPTCHRRACSTLAAVRTIDSARARFRMKMSVRHANDERSSTLMYIVNSRNPAQGSRGAASGQGPIGTYPSSPCIYHMLPLVTKPIYRSLWQPTGLVCLTHAYKRHLTLSDFISHIDSHRRTSVARARPLALTCPRGKE